MNEAKIYELITKMYDEMQTGFKGVDIRFNSVEGRLAGVDERLAIVDGRLAGVEERLAVVEKNVAKIEVEHGQKLAALFDGYVQNSQKLDRIEAKVTKHEEYILKRLK